MRRVGVPQAVQQELSEAVTEGLGEMFAEAQEVAMDRFERRLAEETSKLRLDFAEMKYDLLKWSFLFWVGQVAAVAGLLAARIGR